MAFARAAICRLGHVVSRDCADDPPPPRCSMCGQRVVTECLMCREPIRGPEYRLQQGPNPPQLVKVWAPRPYEPPEVCERCGDRHPWARRRREVS